MQIKKLRSLRSLRSTWLFIASETPLASLAPSKCLWLLIKNSARFARSVKASFCCKYFSRWDGAFLVAYIQGSCLLHMQHAMTTHTTLSWLNSFLFRRQTSLTLVSYTVRLQDLLQCHLLEKGNERAKENCSAVQVTLTRATRALKNNRAAKNAVADQTHRRCLENQQSQSMRHQKIMWCNILRETPSA